MNKIDLNLKSGHQVCIPFANCNFSLSNAFNDDIVAHCLISVFVKTAFSKLRIKTSSKSDDVCGYVVLLDFKCFTVSDCNLTFPSK